MCVHFCVLITVVVDPFFFYWTTGSFSLLGCQVLEMYTESTVQTQCFCITCACLSVCVCKNGHLKWLFLFPSIYLKSFGLTCLRHYFIRYGEKKLRIPKQTEAATEKTLKNWHGNSLMLDKWNYLVWVLRSKSASLPVPFRWWWCCCSFGSCCFCYFLWKITTFWRYISLVFFLSLCLSSYMQNMFCIMDYM